MSCADRGLESTSLRRWDPTPQLVLIRGALRSVHCSATAAAAIPLTLPYPESMYETANPTRDKVLKYAIEPDSAGVPGKDECVVLEFPWSCICAERAQFDRFESLPRVCVATTEKRDALLDAMFARLVAPMAAAERRNLALTGVSGNGKSHNLLRLVLRLRAAGHLVVFMHDMEYWIAAPKKVLGELLFGVMQVLDLEKYSEKRSMALEAVKSTLEEIVRATNGPPGSFESFAGALRNVKRHTDLMGLKKALVDAMFYVDAEILKWLVKTVNDVHAALRRLLSDDGDFRGFFIADQDNRLHRARAMNHTENVNVVFRFTNEAILDGMVLSASANNEGWVRGVIREENMFVGSAESFPFSAAQVLFPAINDLAQQGLLTERSATVMQMKRCFKGYPMCWSVTAKHCQPYSRLKCDATAKSGTNAAFDDLKVASDILTEMESTIRKKISHFSDLSERAGRTEDAMINITLRRLATRHHYYDKNFFEEVQVRKPTNSTMPETVLETALESIYPLVDYCFNRYFLVDSDRLRERADGPAYETGVFAWLYHKHGDGLLLRGAAPQFNELPERITGGQVYVLVPKQFTEAVDVYVLRVTAASEGASIARGAADSSVRRVELVAVKITKRYKQLDSCTTFDQSLGAKCRDVMREWFPGSDEQHHELDFLWISSEPRLEIKQKNHKVQVEWKRFDATKENLAIDAIKHVSSRTPVMHVLARKVPPLKNVSRELHCRLRFEDALSITSKNQHKAAVAEATGWSMATVKGAIVPHHGKLNQKNLVPPIK